MNESAEEFAQKVVEHFPELQNKQYTYYRITGNPARETVRLDCRTPREIRAQIKRGRLHICQDDAATDTPPATDEQSAATATDILPVTDQQATATTATDIIHVSDEEATAAAAATGTPPATDEQATAASDVEFLEPLGDVSFGSVGSDSTLPSLHSPRSSGDRSYLETGDPVVTMHIRYVGSN